jgi:L-lactate utilization protein LutB
MNQKVFNAAMNEATWNESNSLLAQRDMRQRCATKAAEMATEEIAKLNQRIAELERQLNQRTGRVHSANQQIDAVLQTPQHDLLWA